MPDFHESLNAALERLENKCECGFELESFACRIRHQQQPIIGWGRAAKD